MDRYTAGRNLTQPRRKVVTRHRIVFPFASSLSTLMEVRR